MVGSSTPGVSTAAQDKQQSRFHSLPVRKSLNFLLRTQPEPLQQQLRVGFIPRRINRLHEIHVPAESHRFVKTHVVRSEADVPFRGDLFVGDAMTKHAYFAAIWIDQPHQDANCGGLTCAIRTNQTHNRSAMQPQGDVL